MGSESMKRGAPVLALALACAPAMPQPLDAEDMPRFDLGTEPPAANDPHDPTRQRSRDELFAQMRAYETACPLVRYPELSPQLQAGPTFDRVAERLHTGTPQHAEGLGAYVLRPRLTDLALADHPVRAPGLRFVHAYDFASACIMGWSHRNCFVDATAVYCDFEPDFVAFVRDQGLHQAPERLTAAAWSELVATFSAGERRILGPEQARVCNRLIDAPRAARVRPHSEVRAGFADVVVVVVDRDEIVSVHARVEHGSVSWRRETIWAPEPDPLDDVP